MYNHTAINVVNLAESEAFYAQLGFTRHREWKKPTEQLEAIVMKKDGFLLELVYSPTNTVLPTPTLVERQHIGIVVNDLPKVISNLEASGVTILRRITKGVSVKEFAFVADPGGNAVELLVEI